MLKMGGYSFIFVALFALIVPEYSPIMLVPLCGAYVVAWLAGLVTPGAPAGIGVREIVLLLLLGSSVAEADLLLVVVLGRIVTMVGDILYFITSIMLSKYQLNGLTCKVPV
jgi:uncharacterized membrane protein YbhN (UPF0104 family)